MADEHIPANLTALGRFYRRSGLRQRVRRRRRALVYHAARVAAVALRARSLPRALVFADRAGDLAFRTLPSLRRLALTHLAIALGETHSTAARDDIARQAHRNTARCIVELAKLGDIRPHFDDYVSVEGWEHFTEVHAFGRGAIAITGHIGNWQLLAAYVGYKGIPIAAVATHQDEPRINRLLTDFYTGNGVQVILRHSGTSARETLRVLRQRGILAMQLDIDVRVPSVSVPLFGRLARPSLPMRVRQSGGHSLL